jgi:hypothetical protein
MAAQKPNTIAAPAQLSGQGMALRTAMRGALIVRRRRSSRSRISAVDPQAQQYSRKKSRNKYLVRLCFGSNSVINAC